MIPPWKLFGRLGNTMFQGAYLYAQTKKGEIPDIYIQDEKFFEAAKDDIRILYSNGIPKPTDMIAIHVRRGDYVNNPFYVDLIEIGYYEKAMAEFPGEEFLVFSDDIEWCKQQEIFKGCEFSEGRTEIEDMNLMASCKGHIIANSSFSWWGAWLSPNYPNNKVIAPDFWYSDGVDRTITPKHWIKL